LGDQAQSLNFEDASASYGRCRNCPPSTFAKKLSTKNLLWTCYSI